MSMFTDAIARIERVARDANTFGAYNAAIAALIDLPETEEDIAYVEDAVTRLADARDTYVSEE